MAALYDWRLGAKMAAEKARIPDMARVLHKLSGKAVHIQGLSYGSNVGYAAIASMPMEERKKVIKSFNPSGGPLLGSYFLTGYLLGAPIEMSQGTLKLDQKTMTNILENTPVLLELFPKDLLAREKDSDWVKSVDAYDDYVEGKGNVKTNPIPYMPSVNEVCTPGERDETAKLFTSNKDKAEWVLGCRYNLKSQHTIENVKGTKYTTGDRKELLDKYGLSKKTNERFHYFNDVDLDKYENLGIPVNVMYLNNVATEAEKEFKKINENGSLDFSDSVTKYTSGDQTVAAYSVLGPGFKWAHEFDQKLKGSQRVKFVHMCGANERNLYGKFTPKVNTQEEWLRAFNSNENAYLPVSCNCSNDQKMKDSIEKNEDVGCSHVGMFGEGSFYKFMAMNMTNKGKEDENKLEGLSEFAKSVDEKYLKQLRETCMLEKYYFLENWENNFRTKNGEFFRRADANYRRRMIKKRVATH